MIDRDPHEIDVVVRVRARPETVFRYFTDPTLYRTWMGQDAELDPQPGGLYRVLFPGRPAAEGRYLVVDPPLRLVFTWGWVDNTELPPGSTRVEVELTPDGDATIVRLVHSGFAAEADRVQHREGWDHYLARLSMIREEDPEP